MKHYEVKYYIGVILIILVDSLHLIMFESNERYDVYMFYNHERYLTNILYDISNLFKFSVLTYWLIDVSKKIFKPLFLVSLITWFFYFLYYNQKISVLIVPIYIILMIYYSYGNKSNKK